MTIAYGAQRGRICREYYGGSTDDYPDLKKFGAGNETQSLPAGFDRLNGVTYWDTAGAAGDSHGRYWPDMYRPGIMEDGFLREASGTLITQAQIMLPSLATMTFFFGIHKDKPGATDNVASFLTAAANGVISFVEDDLAGFYYSPSFTDDPSNWRLVAAKGGGGLTAGSASPVKSDVAIEAYPKASTDPATPAQKPMLELNVVYDGTVEYRYNGVLLNKRPQAIDPEQFYAPVLLIQSQNAAAHSLGVSYFGIDFRHYAGPVLRG